MGIRFECPNGHRLNVKSFLVGKRGVCPDCDAKFIVPKTSGGRAALVNSTVAPEAASAGLASVAAPPLPDNKTLPITIDQALPDVWYVRPASGEQYGPANSELMHSWVAEGRVAEDCWVWRTGWDQWKTASEALEMFVSPPPPTATTTNPAFPPELQTDVRSPEESFSARVRRPKLASRRKRARKMSIALGSLILLLTVALVLVLWIQK